MREKLLYVFVAGIVALVAVGALLGSRGPDPNAIATAAEVESRIESPFCPGIILAECRSGQASELRSEVAARVRARWTNQQMDTWLIAEYGPQVIARPQTIVAWLVPAVAIVIGLALVMAYSRRSTRQSTLGRGNEPLPSSNERAHLEAELRQFAKEVNE